MIPEIPLEIFHRFLSFIDDHKTLYAICLSTKSLLPPAQEALYHSITLDDNHIQDVVDCLIASPRVATLVRSLSVSGNSARYIDRRNPSHPVSGNSVINHLPQIQKLLTCLPRLVHLSLRYGSYGPWILPEERGCPFRLRSFHHEFLDDSNVFQFLEFQSELTELTASQFWIHNLPFPLSSTSLPKLEFVSAPSSFVKLVVPGRPIHTVATHTDVIPTSPEWMIRSTARLGVQNLQVDMPLLEQISGSRISQLCPNLLHLNVIGGMVVESPGVSLPILVGLTSHISYHYLGDGDIQATDTRNLNLRPFLAITRSRHIRLFDGKPS